MSTAFGGDFTEADEGAWPTPALRAAAFRHQGPFHMILVVEPVHSVFWAPGVMVAG